MKAGTKYGSFECSICPPPKASGKHKMAAEARTIDSGYGGILRHCCGTAHVKKWIAANAGTEATVESLVAQLPPNYTSARVKKTTQYSQLEQRRVVKQRVAAAEAAVRTAFTETPLTGAAATPLTGAAAGAGGRPEGPSPHPMPNMEQAFGSPAAVGAGIAATMPPLVGVTPTGAP